MDSDWNMNGCRRNDPARLKSPDEVITFVEKVGFLPLFSTGIPGFSLEEHVPAFDWWTDDQARDPWIWRMLIAEDENIAYGKFFDRKAGFVSRKWFPAFANYRRDGYDYEGLYEDGKMKGRAKQILDVLQLDENAIGLEMMSGQLRKMAGIEKGFDNILIDLQMQSFLLISRFQQKRNKRGGEYGWHLPSFMTPETKWGYDYVNSADEKPDVSWERIVNQIRKHYPAVEENVIRKLMKR
jgi:hypothetical protein